MDKVILVMNDPTCCVNCPLLRTSRMPNTWVCGIPHNNENVDIVFEPVDIDSDTKPDWCPLRPVPQRKNSYTDAEESKDWYEIGYNQCLSEIMSN